MQDEFTPSLSDEGAPTPKPRKLGASPYRVPLLWFVLFASIGLGVFFVFRPLGCPAGANPSDIAALKSQTATLSQRLDQLEASANAPSLPRVTLEQMKDIENRITTLSQQIEAFQNQPKVGATPQPAENPAVEKEIARLGHTQKLLKSIFLFWRLKAKVLSQAPYAPELADFKTVVTLSEDLSLLEKYADQGLQVLKEEASPDILTPSQAEPGSWWDRLKALTHSFIKIEKVDGSLPSLPLPASQDRQAVEDILDHLDQSLVEQLSTAPAPSPSSPLLGDAL